MMTRPFRAALVLPVLLAASGAWAKVDGPTLRDRQQAACSADAQRLCGDALPDVAKTEACMKGKRAQVSAGCAKMWDVKK